MKGFRVPALAAGKVMWDPAELWDIRIQLPGAVYMRKQAGSCSGQQGWRWHLGGVSSFPPPPALRQHRELWVDAAAPAQAQPFGCSPPSQAAAALSSSCRAFGLAASSSSLPGEGLHSAGPNFLFLRLNRECPVPPRVRCAGGCLFPSRCFGS